MTTSYLIATVFAPLTSSSVGWHIKCEWHPIHIGNLGQLEVLSLSEIGNIRMKFHNMILIDCWKFGGSIIHILMLKPSLFIKLRHHLGDPEKSPMFFSSAILLPSSCIGLNRDSSLVLLQNPGFHLLLHLRPLWRFPLHCLLCLGI